MAAASSSVIPGYIGIGERSSVLSRRNPRRSARTKSSSAPLPMPVSASSVRLADRIGKPFADTSVVPPPKNPAERSGQS